MDWLKRDIAPLTERVWKALDEAVVTAAKNALAARRIADFDGPKGWDHVAVRLGTAKSSLLNSKTKTGATFSLFVPDVVLLTEIRAEFSFPWTSIEAFERGGPALNTGPAEDAARKVALAEDQLVFYGRPGTSGFLTSKDSPVVPLGDWDKAGQAVADLLGAVEKLDEQGVPGPYAAVLEPDHYYAYLKANVEGGSYPAVKKLKDIVEGVHRSAAITGGALFSTRGGDLVLTVGGDLTVGYRGHDETAVHLFCAESIAAQLLTPAAVCVLKASK